MGQQAQVWLMARGFEYARYIGNTDGFLDAVILDE
jgi:hypothetical protein